VSEVPTSDAPSLVSPNPRSNIIKILAGGPAPAKKPFKKIVVSKASAPKLPIVRDENGVEIDEDEIYDAPVVSPSTVATGDPIAVVLDDLLDRVDSHKKQTAPINIKPPKDLARVKQSTEDIIRANRKERSNHRGKDSAPLDLPRTTVVTEDKEKKILAYSYRLEPRRKVRRRFSYLRHIPNTWIHPLLFRCGTKITQ